MIRLSVITVNKDNAPGLKKTIQSVLEQTYFYIEQIIIDADSNDGSIDVIKSFTVIPPDSYQPKVVHNSPGISYWISEPDKGIYHGMNKGIKQARGDYCLFLNSGDYLVSDTSMSNFFENQFTEDIIYSNLFLETDNEKVLSKFPDEMTFSWLYNEYLGHPSTLIKRKLFNRLGTYNEKLIIASDWEFFLLAIAKYQCSTKYFNQQFAVHVRNGISSQESIQSLVKKERNIILNNHFKLFISDYERLNLLQKKTTKNLKAKFLKLCRSFF